MIAVPRSGRRWRLRSAPVPPSARIISTDVRLLLFWSFALLSLVKLLRGGGFGWSILLGGAIGLGLLSKYAMIYFLLCALVAAAFSTRTSAVSS